MGGLQSSDLIIVAGRPGMGKTALATNIAYNIAKAWQGEVRPDGHITTVNGGIVGFFSLEMSAEQLATRILAERTGIPSSTIRRGGISEQDFEVIRDVSLELQNMKFFVDETGGLSIAQLAARARRLKRQRGLDLLVIDYIQLLSGSSKRSQDNRVQEITEITTNLKALAKELNVPIIALSQLSRQVESRDDKRPQLSDLARIGLDRAGRRRGAVRVSRGILPRQQGAAARYRRTRQVADRNGTRCTARPKSSSASSATARPAPSACNSTPASPASAISPRKTSLPERIPERADLERAMMAAILLPAPRWPIDCCAANQNAPSCAQVGSHAGHRTPSSDLR